MLEHSKETQLFITLLFWGLLDPPQLVSKQLFQKYLVVYAQLLSSGSVFAIDPFQAYLCMT